MGGCLGGELEKNRSLGDIFSISLFKSADLRCLHAKSRAVRFPWAFAACDGQGNAGVSLAARRGEVFLRENPGLKERLVCSKDK